MTRVGVARAVSIAAHPAVVMPVAAVIAGSGQGASPQQLQLIGGALGALGVVVVAFSWRQVRAGRWSHVDASVPKERTRLNVFLATVCLLSAALLWFLAGSRALPVALALSSALVLAALLSAAWVKTSLHTAFAAFATVLLWPSLPAVIGGVLVTAAVVWSRLALRRHVVADVAAGLLLGVAAGAAFQLWTK